VAIVLLFAGASFWFGNLALPLQILLIVLAAIGIIVILRLPVIRTQPVPVALPADGERQTMRV
jgi:hypothetical protein